MKYVSISLALAAYLQFMLAAYTDADKSNYFVHGGFITLMATVVVFGIFKISEFEKDVR